MALPDFNRQEIPSFAWRTPATSCTSWSVFKNQTIRLGLLQLFKLRSKYIPFQTALPDNRRECPNFKLRVIWYRNRDGGIVHFSLHDDMTASSPNFYKSMFSKYCTDVLAGQNLEFSQLKPLDWSSTVQNAFCRQSPKNQLFP